MISEGPSVYQTTQAMVRRELREGLLDVGGWPGSGGFGSVVYRAAAGLYALLLEHSVDRRGCCCSCRRPGAVVGRSRRRCRIYPVAQHWLHQPRTALLVSSLVTELGLSVTPPSVAGSGPDRPGFTVTGRAREETTDTVVPADLDDTEERPRIVPDPDHRTNTAQSLAVPPSASLPAESPGRGGRNRITLGPGSTPTALGPAVAHLVNVHPRTDPAHW
ncbi:MAG: hypothetical protein ACRDSL_11005 [Pseudonocardiaceae bacterium]